MELLEAMASAHGALVKVGVFVLVQALVYIILSQSSAVFSRAKTLGLRPPAQSPSARRLLALLSDLPPLDGEEGLAEGDSIATREHSGR